MKTAVAAIVAIALILLVSSLPALVLSLLLGALHPVIGVPALGWWHSWCLLTAIGILFSAARVVVKSSK